VTTDAKPSAIGMIRASAPDANLTPVRLYQLFSGLGSGGVVVQATAAQIVKDRGWTVTEVKLQPDEIDFLSELLRSQGQSSTLPSTVYFVRCEGRAHEDKETGQVRCVMPTGLDRAVVRLEDARPEMVAPALALLPRSAIAGVAAVTANVGDFKPMIASLPKEWVTAAVEDYTAILGLYAAYTEYLLEFPEQGDVSLGERNTAIRMRNLLGKLAIPAALLGVALPAAGAVPPMGGLGTGEGAGLIFGTNSPQAAQILLAQARGELKRTLGAARTLAKACCGRLLAVMERRSPLAWTPGSPQGQRLMQVGAKLLVAFGCRPMQALVVEKPPVKELAIAGAVLASAGLALYGWRRWAGTRSGDRS
jgi:hypothetical protein